MSTQQAANAQNLYAVPGELESFDPPVGGLDETCRGLMDFMTEATGKQYHAVTITCVILIVLIVNPTGMEGMQGIGESVMVLPDPNQNIPFAIPSCTLHDVPGEVDALTTIREHAVAQVLKDTNIDGNEGEVTLARVFEMQSDGLRRLLATVVFEIDMFAPSVTKNNPPGSKTLLQGEIESSDACPELHRQVILAGFACRRAKEQRGVAENEREIGEGSRPRAPRDPGD